MRRSLMSIVAFLLTMSCAIATETGLPEDKEDAISVMVLSALIEEHCPQYRTNAVVVSEYFSYRHMKISDTTLKFMKETIQIKKKFDGLYADSPTTFCDAIYDQFGDNDNFPHFFVKR